ncbi:MAG: hypothetical protein HY690_16920, partial [Chloroflexi bacterium]|nr:hypothetical protein [Chloroflexota bacterium]
MKTPSSFETLSQSGLGLLGLLLPVLAVALTLALLAYHYSLVRAIVEQAFGIVHGLWDRLADGFRHLSDAVAISLRNLSRHATRDGKWPLVALAVAVPVLLALFLVMVIYDIRLWGSYFEALFGETIELPLLGEVPGGTLSALFPVSASLLLGALAESLLGLHPLPLADLAGPRLAGGMRAGLAVVAALLWLFLTVTVLDVSNVVYEELGRQVAAQRVAEEFDSDATLAQPGPDLFSLPTAAPAAPVELDARTAAKQQALIEAWNGDGRRRAMFNGLAEVSLQLSIIFSWTIFAALALAGLVGLGLVFLGLRGASALMSLGGWLTRVLYVLVQRL